MKKMLQTLRYLSKGVALITAIGFLSIVSTAVITDLIYYLTDRAGTDHHLVALTAPIEFTAGTYALLAGLLLFLTHFKVALANGVSRKTFLKANLLAAVVSAAAFAIFNSAMVAALSYFQFWPILMLLKFFYPQAGWAGVLFLQFAIYFLLIAAGWFVTLAYYRSTVPAKWAISLLPFGLYGLLRVVNAWSGGGLFGAIDDYMHLSLGQGPTIAAASFMAYAAVLCGLVYLLIRRAPLKD